ncbi:uncharacterized protein LOC118273279 isoform X47 [Spodoptera frugiperda]|uniref:Uncharacterized protein LOC118273279 isoform X47 n=1 Tax=Spodoptera frugiperda TaxID=7108 RepID=A0A9R0DLW0_SPOFR|nr:uncharacterized protein LOC118273279 isoform X47 [Spodoptera frugiperda]
MDPGVGECELAERDPGLCVCKEGPTLDILKDIQRLYEEKLEQLDRACGITKMQQQVDLLRSWVSDLVGQNTLLARAVEELETEATTKLMMERQKNSERGSKNIICSKVSELKLLNESLHKENMAKEREIRQLNKDAQAYEQTIMNLRKEMSSCKYHRPEVPKKDAEVMAGMCCTGTECPGAEPRTSTPNVSCAPLCGVASSTPNISFIERSCSVSALVSDSSIADLECHFQKHNASFSKDQSNNTVFCTPRGSLKTTRCNDSKNSSCQASPRECSFESPRDCPWQESTPGCPLQGSPRRCPNQEPSCPGQRPPPCQKEPSCPAQRPPPCQKEPSCPAQRPPPCQKEPSCPGQRPPPCQKSADSSRCCGEGGYQRGLLNFAQRECPAKRKNKQDCKCNKDKVDCKCHKEEIFCKKCHKEKVHCKCPKEEIFCKKCHKEKVHCKCPKEEIFCKKCHKEKVHCECPKEEIFCKKCHKEKVHCKCPKEEIFCKKCHKEKVHCKCPKEEIFCKKCHKEKVHCECPKEEIFCKKCHKEKVHCKCPKEEIFCKKCHKEKVHCKCPKEEIFCKKCHKEKVDCECPKEEFNCECVEEIYFNDEAKSCCSSPKSCYTDRSEERRCNQTPSEFFCQLRKGLNCNSCTKMRNLKDSGATCSLIDSSNATCDASFYHSKLLATLQILQNKEETIGVQADSLAVAEERIATLTDRANELKKELDRKTKENQTLRKIADCCKVVKHDVCVVTDRPIKMGDLQQKLCSLEGVLALKTEADLKYQAEMEMKHQELSKIREELARSQEDTCEAMSMQLRRTKALLDEKTELINQLKQENECQAEKIQSLQEELDKADSIIKENCKMRSEVSYLSAQVELWRAQLEDSQRHVCALDQELARTRAHTQQIDACYREKASAVAELQAHLEQAYARGAALCGESRRAVGAVRTWMRRMRDKHREQEALLKERDALLEILQRRLEEQQSESHVCPTCEKLAPCSKCQSSRDDRSFTSKPRSPPCCSASPSEMPSCSSTPPACRVSRNKEAAAKRCKAWMCDTSVQLPERRESGSDAPPRAACCGLRGARHVRLSRATLQLQPGPASPRRSPRQLQAASPSASCAPVKMPCVGPSSSCAPVELPCAGPSSSCAPLQLKCAGSSPSRASPSPGRRASQLQSPDCECQSPGVARRCPGRAVSPTEELLQRVEQLSDALADGSRRWGRGRGAAAV